MPVSTENTNFNKYTAVKFVRSELTSDFGYHSNYYAMDFITKINHNAKEKHTDSYIQPR